MQAGAERFREQIQRFSEEQGHTLGGKPRQLVSRPAHKLLIAVADGGRQLGSGFAPSAAAFTAACRRFFSGSLAEQGDEMAFAFFHMRPQTFLTDQLHIGIIAQKPR
ncbi:hypothetical protein D3C75_1011360 [compost metagenome]